MNPGAGEICSVACALLWAIVTISLKRAGETVPPFELNLFKNIGIAILLVPAVLFFEFDSWNVFSSSDIWILVLSGVVGVCIADWFLLASLNLLGAGRNAILDCLYSPFVIIFAWFALGEQLTPNRIGGGLLVVAGILIATLPEQNSGKVKTTLARNCLWHRSDDFHGGSNRPRQTRSGKSSFFYCNGNTYVGWCRIGCLWLACGWEIANVRRNFNISGIPSPSGMGGYLPARFFRYVSLDSRLSTFGCFVGFHSQPNIHFFYSRASLLVSWGET